MLKVINVIYLQCAVVSRINRFPAFIVCFLHPLEKRQIEVPLYTIYYTLYIYFRPTLYLKLN